LSHARTRRGELSESKHRREIIPRDFPLHVQRPEISPMRGRLHNQRQKSSKF
jgi:hypothetical protein